MDLISIRIITENIKGMVEFYERITQISVVWHTDDFVELKTPSATLAIGSTNTLNVFGGEQVAKAAQNLTAIIEFRVKDVDEEYKRLVNFLKDNVVQKPTTMPWGNKSVLFRDPDSNLVNLFATVSPEAVKRFDRNS